MRGGRQRAESRSQRSEVRSRKAVGRGRKDERTEVREQRSEVGRQEKAGDRGQRTEVRGNNRRWERVREWHPFFVIPERFYRGTRTSCGFPLKTCENDSDGGTCGMTAVVEYAGKVI